MPESKKVTIELEPHQLTRMQHLLLGLEADQLEDDQEVAAPRERVAMWLKIEMLRIRQRQLAETFMH
jgi:hypothetical protein